MKNILLLVLSSLLLTSCPEAGCKDSSNAGDIKFNIDGIGVVRRVRIADGSGGYHTLYFVDNKTSINTMQQQGKHSHPVTIIMDNGTQYELVPKVEK